MMGIGGGIGANTAQTTALYDFDKQRLIQASVIWNINRQVVFSVGATLVAMIFNTLSLLYRHKWLIARHFLSVQP